MVTDIKGLNKNYRNYLQIDYSYIAFLGGLILLHLFCITRVGLAQAISLLEAFIVLIYLIKGKLSTAVLLFGSFILTSYDSKFFFAEPVGVLEVYNVTLLPVISIYFYLFLSFAIFGISLFNIVKYKIKLNNPFIKFTVFTLVIMIPMGIFTYLSDGFSSLALTRDIKNNVIPALWGVSFFFLFYTNNRFLLKYEKLIIHILLAYIIVGVITSSLNILLERGNRLSVLYLPLSSFFFTSIILFLYKINRKRDKYFVGIMFAFTVFLQLFYDNCLAGKSWFIFLSVIVMELFLYYRRIARRAIMTKITAVLFITMITIVLTPQIISYISDTENSKLIEFISLFKGAKSGNIDNVESSAQFRILEFITISDYYQNHPEFFLFGRGIGGFVPNIGLFVYSKTAFTDDQYISNQFSVMHESMNVIYLKCGFIGLIFFIYVLYNGIRKIKYDPMFFIGIFWLLFYWAYSVNLLFLGLPAFLMGYQKIKSNKII